MNDIEKAIEISKTPAVYGTYFDLEKTIELQRYNAAMLMAAWKQEQMISKMKEFIAEYFYEHPHTSWLICSDEFQDLDDCFERLERYLKEED